MKQRLLVTELHYQRAPSRSTVGEFRRFRAACRLFDTPREASFLRSARFAHANFFREAGVRLSPGRTVSRQPTARRRPNNFLADLAGRATATRVGGASTRLHRPISARSSARPPRRRRSKILRGALPSHTFTCRRRLASSPIAVCTPSHDAIWHS